MTFLRLVALLVAQLLLPTVALPRPVKALQVQAFIDAVEGAQPSGQQGSLAALDLDGLMQRLGVPGVSIAVVWDFDLHWAKGYGITDALHGRRVDRQTLFQAASISKPVTALAVLKLVEDGRFGLDDDINTLLTSWRLPLNGLTQERAVTPRMLLSHTSGLGDGFGFPGYLPTTQLPTAVQILAGDQPSTLGPVRIEVAPMTRAAYSGGGILLMQVAMTDVLGEDFGSFMQQEILKPLGMRHSVFEQPLSLMRQSNAALAHDHLGQRMRAPWHVYPELAAAGLWSTPTDLAHLIISLQRGVRGKPPALLAPAQIRQLFTPVGIGGFGLGFNVSRQGEGWYFSHEGSNWGYRSYLMAHQVNGYGLVVMANGERGRELIDELCRRIQRVYGWDTQQTKGQFRFSERSTRGCYPQMG